MRKTEKSLTSAKANLTIAQTKKPAAKKSAHRYKPSIVRVCKNGCNSEAGIVHITLDATPPSLNKFFGRNNVWEYRHEKEIWSAAVWAACRAAGIPPAPFECSVVTFDFYFKTAVRHDADNYTKLLTDGITKARVISDDDLSHISTVVHGHMDKLNPRTEITIQEQRKE